MNRFCVITACITIVKTSHKVNSQPMFQPSQRNLNKLPGSMYNFFICVGFFSGFQRFLITNKTKYNSSYCKVCDVKNVVKTSEISIIAKITKYTIQMPSIYLKRCSTTNIIIYTLAIY